MPLGKSFLCQTMNLIEKILSRRGSPMVIGVKCANEFAANHIPVTFSKGK